MSYATRPLSSRNPTLLSEESELSNDLKLGLCNGLTSLYCYYQFLGKERVFFERIIKAVSADFDSSCSLEGVSYKDLKPDQKELEHLCNDILYLHRPVKGGGQSNQAVNLSFLSDDKKIKDLSSQFHFAATFSRDAHSKEFEVLVEIVQTMLTADIEKSNFLFLSNGSHMFGIFYKDKKCFLYDPNDSNIFPLYDISKSRDESDVGDLVYAFSELIFEGQDQITLGIDMVSQEELPEIRAKVPELYQNKAVSFEQGSDGYSPLWIAAQNGYLDVVKAFFDKGADIDKPNKFGTTPLLIAAQNGYRDVVEFLITKNAKVNTCNRSNASPLFMAVEKAIKTL